MRCDCYALEQGVYCYKWDSINYIWMCESCFFNKLNANFTCNFDTRILPRLFGESVPGLPENIILGPFLEDGGIRPIAYQVLLHHLLSIWCDNFYYSFHCCHFGSPESYPPLRIFTPLAKTTSYRHHEQGGQESACENLLELNVII